MSLLDNQTKVNLGTSFYAAAGAGGGGGSAITVSSITMPANQPITMGNATITQNGATSTITINEAGGNGSWSMGRQASGVVGEYMQGPSSLNISDKIQAIDGGGTVLNSFTETITNSSGGGGPRATVFYTDDLGPTVKASITMYSSINGGAGGMILADQGSNDTLTIGPSTISLATASSTINGNAGQTIPQAKAYTISPGTVYIPGGGVGTPISGALSTIPGRLYLATVYSGLQNAASDGVSALYLTAGSGLNETRFINLENAALSTFGAGYAQSFMCYYGADSTFTQMNGINTSASASTIVQTGGGLHLLQLN